MTLRRECDQLDIVIVEPYAIIYGMESGGGLNISAT